MPVPPVKPPQRGGIAAKPPPASEDALAKAKRERDELEDECHELEEDLEALKARYEQYFLGVERKEPVRDREELRKRVLRVKERFTRNTGLRFRLQSLYARYLSYERLWLRAAREKEAGTYRRDVFKARLRARGEERAAPSDPAPPPKAAAAKEAQSAPGPSAASDARTRVSPAGAPELPAERPRAPSPPAAAGAMKEPELRALYDAYIAAKKSCKEDVSRLTYDAVVKSVSKQIPELLARFKAKRVEFKVEVKEGKAVLKAIPKG